MINVFGARISDSDVKEITDYLARNYGSDVSERRTAGNKVRMAAHSNRTTERRICNGILDAIDFEIAVRPSYCKLCRCFCYTAL